MDHEDVITLLLKRRDEAYPLERLEAYAQFFYWILDPYNASLRRRVGRMAVARALRANRRSSVMAPFPEPFDFEEAYRHHFPAERVLNAAGWPRAQVDVRDYLFRSWLDSEPTIMIARFLIQDHEHPGPLKRPPSLNRTVHFVENNGYVFFRETGLEDTGRSHKILKEQWAYNHFTSPFLLALWVQISDGELGDDQQSLWPLSSKFLDTYRAIRSSDFLAELFEYAAFIKNRLDDVLFPTAEVELPNLPGWLEPAPVDLGAFNAAQDKIRLAYRA